MHCVLVWNLLLGIACVALHIRIFFSSRAAIRMYPNFSQQQEPITLRFFKCGRASAVTRSQFDGNYGTNCLIVTSALYLFFLGTKLELEVKEMRFTYF
jgi:hypothetical protein